MSAVASSVRLERVAPSDAAFATVLAAPTNEERERIRAWNATPYGDFRTLTPVGERPCMDLVRRALRCDRGPAELIPELERLSPVADACFRRAAAHGYEERREMTFRLRVSPWTSVIAVSPTDASLPISTCIASVLEKISIADYRREVSVAASRVSSGEAPTPSSSRLR